MKVGFAGKIAHAFLDSKLTPLFIAASLGLGALALLATPREEEPQIRVPMVDVMVAWPGAEPAEVENRIVAPIERPPSRAGSRSSRTTRCTWRTASCRAWTCG